MKQPQFTLNERSRAVVLSAVRDTCAAKGWRLLAAHIRQTHVHAIVRALAAPGFVRNSLKAGASRALNRLDWSLVCHPEIKRRRWTHRGSARYIWTAASLRRAMHYVLEEQGRPMATFQCDVEEMYRKVGNPRPPSE